MAHVNTIFGQLLQLVDRHDFRRIEEKGYLPAECVNENETPVSRN